MSNHIMSKVGENHEAKIRGEMSPSRSKVVLCLSYRRLIHCILNDDTRKTESLGLNRTMFFHGDACEFFGREELIRMYSESSMQLHIHWHSNLLSTIWTYQILVNPYLPFIFWCGVRYRLL